MVVFRLSSLVSALVLAVPLAIRAQSPLSPDTARIVDAAMGGQMNSSGDIDCKTQTFPAFLDFALRFEAGFVTACDLNQFSGKPAALALYIRVVSADGKHHVFGDRMNLPAISDARKAKLNWRKFHQDVEFSGAVALGEGRYKLDILLVDDQNRSHRKSWSLNVSARGKEKQVQPAIAANSVSAISTPPWQGARRPVDDERQLTVLLDAAPLIHSSLKLRAWDRAFLLGSLSSLLRQAGAGKVRVIAFNLDQQREIFREDNFDDAAFRRLAIALQNLELGSVSYKTLQSGDGWANLLVKLVNSEISDRDPSDAVIFLGPNSRILDKISPDAIRARADIGQRLFYFEYFFRVGYEFPDTIHHLTSACRGTVFKMHSAADLAASIAKLQRRLNSDEATP